MVLPGNKYRHTKVTSASNGGNLRLYLGCNTQHEDPTNSCIHCSSVLIRPRHFFGKCHSIISPTGPKGTKKEKKNYYKTWVRIRTHTNVRTFPYNIRQNLIGLGVFRKHPSLSKTQTGENVELTVSKNCNPFFSSFDPLLASQWVLWTPVCEILVRTLLQEPTEAWAT